MSVIAAADFNGDGRSDLLASTSSGVVVLLSQGNSSFAQRWQFGNLGSPAVGDFNGDGKADVVFASGNSLSVFFGNGDGTFQSPKNSTIGVSAGSLFAADFNGDGRLDLAALDSSNSDVTILLGNGDGTFQVVANKLALAGGRTAMAVGDFNGDGRADLAVVEFNSPVGQVFLGNGDGTFQPAISFNAPPVPNFIAVGDFNGDGRQDLVIVPYDSSFVEVLLGNGDGSFQSQQAVHVAFGTLYAAVGDFNGDGLADLAVTSSEFDINDVTVLLSNGDGTFRLEQTIRAANPSDAKIGDFNGDGRLGLAVNGGDGVSIFLGNGNGSFQTAPNYGGGGNARLRGVAVGDFNGDAEPDLAATDVGSNTVSVQLGNGDGTFQPAVNYAVGDFPVSVAVGDFNGDGRPDLVVANGSSDTVSVLLGNGDGTFQAAQSVGVTSGPSGVAVGDFNGDGRLDLAVIGDSVSIFFGNGDGTFTAGQNLPVCGALVLVGDFNGDGRSDVVGGGGFCNNSISPVSIFLGNGDGTFQSGQAVSPAGSPAATGDFDGDGRLDLVVETSTGVSIFLGNGDGTFQAGQNIAMNNISLATAAVADFNHDGRADLAICNNGRVSVLLGNGDGSFQPAQHFVADLTAFGPAAGDFNGDGLPDIAVSNIGDSNNSSSDVSILINNTSSSSSVGSSPLTVAANNVSRQYGAAGPAFTVSYSGFVSGDGPASLSGSLVCASNTTASSAVGSYPIACSGLSSQKYAISYAPGVLTITPAPLTVTANSATSILHGSLLAFTASYSGFVNGDGPSSLGGALNCTTNATTASAVGSYAINCSGQSSNNYSITSKSGTLRIIYQPAGTCDGQMGHLILPPINASGTNVYKQGRTIPAQFRVCDANGVSIGAPGVVASFNLTQIGAGTSGSVDQTVSSGTPDRAFRWDSSGQEWIFNISTKSLAAGQSYGFTIALNDGSKITFGFGLR